MRHPRFAVPRLLRPLLPALALLLPLACALATGCSDDDPDARKVSELKDADHIAECERERTQIGMEGQSGARAYACYRSASAVSGTCNEQIFSNCVSQASSPCLAPAADSPLRSCSATVGDLLACAVAVGQQYAAYRTVTCAAAPTSMPKLAKELPACATLCGQCAGYPGCQ